MLDIRQIADATDEVVRRLKKRHEPTAVLERIIKLDNERRMLEETTNNARGERNRVSKAIGNEKRAPTVQEKNAMRELGNSITNHESQLRELEAELRSLLLTVPNLPLEDVAAGADETDNEVVEEFGDPKRAAPSKPHWDIAQELGLYDLEAASRISGARFYLLRGAGALLNRALAAWMLDIQTKEFGYTEVEPPVLVHEETMIKSGNLPKFRDNLYHDDETNLWLIPTAEVALTAIWSGKILKKEQLPIKYVAATNCFRKEHTAGGRDVRGIKRVHQFQKVEMYRYETPSASETAQREMLRQAKILCERLGFRGRVLKLCAGEMGFQAARTYDIEIWAPGSNEWLEVSSVSTCTDFQARRANIRYRESPAQKPRWVHTLNGSGLALPRIWAALLENGLQSDGKIGLPEVLRDYCGAKIG